MAEDDDSQERTLEATPKRKQQLREEAQVPRSRELNRVMLLLSGAIIIFFTGKVVFDTFHSVTNDIFNLSHQDLITDNIMLIKFGQAIYHMFLSLLPFFIATFLIVFLTPFMLGGFVISKKAIAFKGGRMNPLKGLKKIVSINSLTELIKSIIKFCVILATGILVLWLQFPKILVIGQLPIEQAIIQGLTTVSIALISISSVLIFIAAIDVPIQIYQHSKKSKMTLKEMKDEMKETDGSPEMKHYRRSMQQTLAHQRMMQEVPKASVVITNPTHYAVALYYDQNSSHAPKVIAKGVDYVAEKIIAVAKENKVSIFQAPPLARSIYFSTKIGYEIPQGLYIAVAKILAYLYQLKHFTAGFGSRPVAIKEFDLPIPEDLKHE